MQEFIKERREFYTIYNATASLQINVQQASEVHPDILTISKDIEQEINKITT